MSKLDQAVSAVIGGMYGGVTGASGGTLGLAGGVAIGVIGGITAASGSNELHNEAGITLKLKTFFVTAAAGFSLGYISTAPDVMADLEKSLSGNNAVATSSANNTSPEHFLQKNFG